MKKEPIVKHQDKTPWGLVFILFGAGILSACQVGKVPPVLLDIRSDLNISFIYAGWILSIFNVAGLLFSVCTGIIADTFGHRRLILTGFFLLTAGSLMGSVSQTFPSLICARFIEGAGFLFVIVGTPTLIFQVVCSKDLKVALSIWSCYLPAGTAFMMVIAPLIIQATNWRWFWQLNAFFLAAYGIILYKASSSIKSENNNSPERIEPRKMIKKIHLITTSRGPLLLALIFIAYTFQWLCVMGFLPTLLIEKFEFSKSLASILTAFMVAVNILGNLAGGRLLTKGVQRWKLIALANTVMGLSVIAIYSDTQSFQINYVGCLTFSIFGGLIPASIFSGVPIYSPSKRLIGTTNGLVIQGGQLGQVVGPPLLAFLVSQTGSWFSGAYLLGGVAFLAIIASLKLSRVEYSASS